MDTEREQQLRKMVIGMGSLTCVNSVQLAHYLDVDIDYFLAEARKESRSGKYEQISEDSVFSHGDILRVVCVVVPEMRGILDDVIQSIMGKEEYTEHFGDKA